MGACNFITRARGKTAADAFREAVASAKHEYGHGGYTGTIAEKTEFIMIAARPGVTPEQQVSDMIEEDDSRVRDKWGPAGCIDLGGGAFLFFGWASS